MAGKKQAAKVPAIIGRGCDSEGRQTFSVASRTSEGASYRVTRHEHHLECTCLASQYHPETPCCHRKAVHTLLIAERDAQTRRVAVATANRLRDTAPLYRSNAPFSIWKS